MKALPTLTIDSKAYLQGNAEKGNLINKYIPFKNLVNTRREIINFRTKNFVDSLGKQSFDINSPINIEIQPSFDGSVNLILNNDVESPKLINSRFSVEEADTFSIPDHRGNRDSNLYNDDQLKLDSRLYKTINKIPTLNFKGLSENGKMKCGSYHFYFKLTDNDGNETDFITESGLVVCHIGNYQDPGSVRMGMVDENSGKSINFSLLNIDSSYDFVKVYYTRTTSDNSQQDIITAHYIDNKYPINSNNINISITGLESHTDISINDININYELVDTVKAQAQCQNILFFGNLNKTTIPYEFLEKESLNFTPEIVQEDSIGNLNNEYKDVSGKESYEYYNPSNLYYKLGYWPEEYYRFGIVYIMNDYTLSPVFNTRGVEFAAIEPTSNYITGNYQPSTGDYQIKEDGFIANVSNFENAKGIIKIPKTFNSKSVITSAGIKPWGIKFTNLNTAELKNITKGYFIVRQERVPTIYAQGLSIAKTKNDYGNIPILSKSSYSDEVGAGYFAQSFLNSDRRLRGKFVPISPSRIDRKAAIVPEAIIRNELFAQLFTSSEFKISKTIDPTTGITLSQNANNFYLDKPYIQGSLINKDLITSKLTMVKDGMSLTTNGEDYFSAKAGDAEQAWNTINVSSKWTSASVDGAINRTLTDSTNLVRGEFGTYIGMDKELPFGTIFNIRPNDFSEDISYKENMFKVRMDSSEPYMAVSDRVIWNSTEKEEQIVFRGDCFIGNFTHRMHRNFIDPELPTNHKIIDQKTWIKNYAVFQDAVVNINGENQGVNRVLHTYKQKIKVADSENNATYPVGKILEPSDSNYTNAGSGLLGIFDKSEYKEFGCSKINRGDVNAVPLGHWVTFKVMSNFNLSMRDVDFDNVTEEAIHGKKRGFYPLDAMDINSSIKESSIINGACNVTLSKRPNFIVPDVPFIKNKFDTRILYSDIHTTDAFKNGYRVFSSGHYRDYTKTYGAIVDMKEWYGNLFVTMEHGCLLIPVNERAIAGEGQGGNVYINTSNVLPENPKVISDLFGSTWGESVIKTKTGIYGIDAVAKKIWKSDGQTITNISDLKVQRFLNENITLKESDKIPTIGIRNIKSHYNKNKGDIIFTFYNGEKEWALCYNENLQKFTTFYSWIPSHSANINNVFFSLNKKDSKDNLNLNGDGTLKLDVNKNMIPLGVQSKIKLWKHGQSGIYNNQGLILPTNWYGKQEPFTFEFVVAENPSIQKIFNNLKIISNKAEPDSFEFEVVGEGYEWWELKDIVIWINENLPALVILAGDNGETADLNKAYKYVLGKTQAQLAALTETSTFPRLYGKIDEYKMPKLPFIPRVRRTSSTTGLDNYELSSANTKIIADNLLNEERVHTQQLGNDLKKFGRIRGNMQYLEDSWDIEIKPLNFKYGYLSGGALSFTNGKEARIRDKYLKIKVIYSGKDLAIVQGIKTIFTQSFA